MDKADHDGLRKAMTVSYFCRSDFLKLHSGRITCRTTNDTSEQTVVAWADLAVVQRASNHKPHVWIVFSEPRQDIDEPTSEIEGPSLGSMTVLYTGTALTGVNYTARSVDLACAYHQLFALAMTAGQTLLWALGEWEAQPLASAYASLAQTSIDGLAFIQKAIEERHGLIIPTPNDARLAVAKERFRLASEEVWAAADALWVEKT